jgi:zinc/manganese transport system substrate-binding protein
MTRQPPPDTTTVPTSVRRWSPQLCATLVAVCLAATACGGSDVGGRDAGPVDGTAAVLATTPILADVTARALCGRVEVPSIVPRGADAHDFEPSVREADRIRTARLVVANGLGLEELLESTLEQAQADGVTVTELGPVMDPLPAGGDAGSDHDDDEHGHGSEDPHVWMDPDRMATGVRSLGGQLAAVDGLPVAAEEIRACADAYAAELEALGREMDDILAVVPPPARALVTNHESLGYFADRFGFRVVGTVVPSTSSLAEANPRALEQLARTMQAEGVDAIFAEVTDPPSLAAGLADRVGGEVQVIELSTETLGPPGSDTGTYVDMMRTDARRVAAALGAGTAAVGG